MSTVPQHTQILIKDLDFQAKYHLSHTQVDVMAYMANVPYWAEKVDGYFVIATSKVLSDLPHLGLKNFEPAFKALKTLGLIESKIVHVVKWKRKPKLRGIRLTEKGKEYHKKLMLPTQDKKLRELEKEVKRLHGVDEENLKLKEMLEALTVGDESVNEEPKKTPEPQMPEKEEIDTFIQTVVKHFGANSKPICNFVPTYQKETTFYINSYNRLSLITSEKNVTQLKNPLEISQFWQWLFLNSQRVGNKIDFSKTPTVKQLKQRFIGRTIKINGEAKSIIDFKEIEGKVKLQIQEKDGTKRFILNGETHEEMLFEPKKCQDILLV